MDKTLKEVLTVVHDDGECNWRDAIASFNECSLDYDNYYNIDASMKIFYDWCVHHSQHPAQVCYDITNVLEGKCTLVVNGSKETFSAYILRSLIDLTKRTVEWKVSLGTKVVRSLDIGLLYVENLVANEDLIKKLFNILNTMECFPCIFVTDGILDTFNLCNRASVYCLHETYPLISTPNLKTLNPRIWSKLLVDWSYSPSRIHSLTELCKEMEEDIDDNIVNECYGCTINHPSQVQHMGPGGCLEN